VSLDILHVYAEDAGTYTCRATNVLGQAVNSADLIVRAKETIVKDTIHQAAVEQVMSKQLKEKNMLIKLLISYKKLFYWIDSVF
jgi:titin